MTQLPAQKNHAGISVVIPAYNRCADVIRLLTDINNQTAVPAEVIVVDDGSTDGTVGEINRKFPWVTVVQSGRQGGPCVARNIGIKTSKSRIIVGLDSDVSLPDAQLFEKIEFSFNSRPADSGFAFRLLRPDGQEDNARWWHPVKIAEFSTLTFETDYFSGTAYAFRRKEMMDAGIFPEVLFMCYEEVELAFRILDKGGRIRYLPELIACHHASPIAGRGNIDKFFKPRNQILLAFRCLPLRTALAFLAPRLIFNCLRSLCHPDRIELFGKAVFSAIKIIKAGPSARKPISRATLRKIKLLKRFES
ncbi:MAG: glycosyltransferase [Chthoniobacteraceae bacterium]|nr:glycosyltransferase [Chthoniobacteraceae bacterium]